MFSVGRHAEKVAGRCNILATFAFRKRKTNLPARRKGRTVRRKKLWEAAVLYAACKRGVRSPLRARSKQASSGYAAHCVPERKRAATIQRNFGRNTGSLRPWRTPAALKACKGRNRREKHRAWFVENYGARPDNLDEEQWVSQARKALWLLCRAAQSDAQGICGSMCNPWRRLMAAGRCLLASCCRLFFRVVWGLHAAWFWGVHKLFWGDSQTALSRFLKGLFPFPVIAFSLLQQSFGWGLYSSRSIRMPMSCSPFKGQSGIRSATLTV